MTHRPPASLDSRLLALLTVAFSLLCSSALWLDLRSAPEPPVAQRRA